VARQQNSIALEADAHHLSVDVYTSVGVFVGLLVMRATGWHALDGVIALGLAVAIGWIAWDLTHRAAQPLLDARLPEEQEQQLVETICAHPVVVGCHAVRSRSAGGQTFFDAHVTVPPDTSLEAADRLEDDLRAQLQARYPRLDVMLHVEPAAPEEKQGA
jgi:cation diffusion facilitator family transporter